MDASVVSWLLEGPPFVRFATLRHLHRDHGDQTSDAYAAMLADPLVQDLVAACNQWETQDPIKRHNDAWHPLHRLVFAASIGVDAEALAPAIDSILSHQSPEGPFQIRIVIPRAFGGDDIPRWDWVATDAPLILFALLRLGVRGPEIDRAVTYLRDHVREDGVPCFASGSMGAFRGPGRRTDPCPYAGLIFLRMLAEVPGLAESRDAEWAVGCLLDHWEKRRERKLRMFGIGTDFAKPKAPRIWYDVVHFVDTLARFPSARADSRLQEVAGVLSNQMDADGRITARSAWLKWKGWEFAQKKEPSRWLTFLAHRALERAHGTPQASATERAYTDS